MFERHFSDMLPVQFERFEAIHEEKWTSTSFQLLWTQQQAFECNIGNRDRTIVRGQLLLVRPMMTVRLTSRNPIFIRCLIFQSPLLQSIPGFSISYVLSATSHCKRLLTLIQGYRRQSDANDRVRVSSLLFSLLSECFLNAEPESLETATPTHSKPVQRKKTGLPIVYAVRYMRKHMANPDLSLQEIAGAVGYNPNYFCQEFSQIFGVSPIRHLNELRMNRALAYLEDTDDQIKRICEQVGIRNPGNFTSMVKNKVGMTPMEYRRNKRTKTLNL
ncbi:helix-turn-helix transcriptional regulator [Cohnella suwonensis]|uniref:Helix-turn-helix transcriptional regulator n=1 Tax=Cohnella suwonensis TaxID=696072 RepID=A0ABW0LTV4_9BACL